MLTLEFEFLRTKYIHLAMTQRFTEHLSLENMGVYVFGTGSREMGVTEKQVYEGEKSFKLG